jgi:branched-chain amino acid transport system permease protein
MLGLAFSISWKVGLIRLELAAYWAIGAYSTGLLMTKADWSFWPTILVGGLLAILISLGICVLTLPRGSLVFFAFCIVFGLVVQQVLGTADFFGGWNGIQTIPRPVIGSFIFTNRTEYYFMGLAFIAINLLVFYLLYNSKIGRAWTSIGSSVNLAQSLGVNVIRYQISTVVLGSFFAAVSGSYFASYQLYITPASFGFFQSILVPMYSVVGGLSHFLLGPVVGAIVVTFIPMYLKFTAEIEPIITSIVLILVILFLPMGVLDILKKLWRSSLFDRIRSKLAYLQLRR